MKYLSPFPILMILCFFLCSCRAEIDVTPEQAPEEKAPKFNFLARQIESSVVMNDTTIVMDTVKAELYIKQLDYTVEEEKYRLIVTLPGNFDGLIHYKGAIYRSGDWIEIYYKDLENYATVLHITQNTGLSKPIATGQYNLNLICSDSKENSKSAALTIMIP